MNWGVVILFWIAVVATLAIGISGKIWADWVAQDPDTFSKKLIVSSVAFLLIISLVIGVVS